MKKTGSKLLLDTNIVIEVMRGNHELAEKINRHSGFAVSVTVAGELYIGVNRVSNKVKHMKMLARFLDMCTILSVDQDTAVHYGAIASDLQKKGKPIPTNDIWIAASAVQHGYTLATRDNHFREIDGLQVKHW